jgi:hypothetical protein
VLIFFPNQFLLQEGKSTTIVDIFGEILGYHLLKQNKVRNKRGTGKMQDIFSLWMLGENPCFKEAITPYPIWTSVHNTQVDIYIYMYVHFLKQILTIHIYIA